GPRPQQPLAPGLRGERDQAGGLDGRPGRRRVRLRSAYGPAAHLALVCVGAGAEWRSHRSEEHTSELQSPCNVVCRLLLDKKNLVQEQSKNACVIFINPMTTHFAESSLDTEYDQSS